jgi:hypothetical protein
MNDKNLPMELDEYKQLLEKKADALKNLADALKDFHSQPDTKVVSGSKNSPEIVSEKKPGIKKPF